MAGFGAFAGGLTEGLGKAIEFKDRIEKVKAQQQKLDEEKQNIMGHAALAHFMSTSGLPQGQGQPMQPPPGAQQAMQPPGGMQGRPQPGQPNSGYQSQPLPQPGGPQPPMPGQASVPMQPPAGGGGAPPGSSPGGAQAAPGPAQFDAKKDLMEVAEAIKRVNPGIGDRALFSALKEYAALTNPEQKMALQAQLAAYREQSAMYRTDAGIQGRQSVADTQVAGRKDVADTGAASREKVAAQTSADRQRGQDLTHQDRMAAVDASLQRAQFIQGELNKRFTAGAGDKVALQARLSRSREIVAQLNAAQRIMNGITMAKLGADPSGDPQYKRAQSSYEDAQKKLAILEKASDVPPGVGSVITGKDGKKYRITGGDPSDPDVEEVTQ